MDNFEEALAKHFKEDRGKSISPLVDNYWISARGRQPISGMSTNHINNCINLIKRGEATIQAPLLPFLQAELKRRGTSSKQPGGEIPISDYTSKIFTDTFIDENNEKIDWNLLVKTQELTAHVLQKYKKKLPWKNIYVQQRLPDEYILMNSREIIWDLIIYNKKYDDNFFEEWAEFINWKKLAEIRKLSFRLIEQFHFKIGWKLICQTQKLSEEFISANIKKIQWSELSYNLADYSINFIKKYENKISWKNASESENLPLEIIEEFQHKVDWSSVCKDNKNLNFDFVIKYRHRIKFEHVSVLLKKEFGKSITADTTTRMNINNLQARVNSGNIARYGNVDYGVEDWDLF